MQILRQHAAAVEDHIIDEAFLSLAGMSPRGLEPHARQVREVVRQWTGIPIGVEVAATKVLAKLANRQAKKTAGVVCARPRELSKTRSAGGGRSYSGWS